MRQLILRINESEATIHLTISFIGWSVLKDRRTKRMKYEYDSDVPFSAFITNLGKYNEGDLVGEWVSFPTDPETMAEVFKRIGIGSCDAFGNRYEEFFITDYECYVPGLYDKFGEYESLDELNMLANKIEDLDEYDYQIVAAALEMGVGGSSVADIINLTENLDCFELYPDIEDESDLGYYLVNDSGLYDTASMGTLADYIDYKSLGRDAAINEDSMFTQYGYLVRTSDPSYIIYDGKNMQEDYKLHAGSYNYLENAEMALEDDYNLIDGIINNGKKEERTYKSKDSVKDKLTALCSECSLKNGCDIPKVKIKADREMVL